MPNKIIIFCALFFSLMLGGNVYAQECSVNYEMITKLHHPDSGSFTVWDSLYGQAKNDERFVSIINKDDGVVMAVGEVISAKGSNPSLIFVEYDKRGRQVWEKEHLISGIVNIVKMMHHKDGVAVLVNRSNDKDRGFLWLGFFDYKGVLKSQKLIKDTKYSLLATDIIHSANNDNKGFAVSVTVERDFGKGRNNITRKNAVMYLLDEGGNELSSRSYIVGTNNEIMGLSVSRLLNGKTGYNATGYFESPTGKKIGWVLRLGHDTSYIWQKEYGRGLSANIKLSFGYHDRYILTFGDVLPVDSSPIGSWLMLLDGENGEILWQRYYYGETGYHNYLPKGLYVSDNGLITLMMMAKPRAVDMLDYDSYAHLLTLSPRGVTLSGDSYKMGSGASVSQVIEGKEGYRIMAGSAFVPSQSMKDKMPKKKHPSPLKEEGYINLPDIDLSDKANKGLTMLKNKIKEQKMAKHDSESTKDDIDDKSITQNGWVIIGDMPKTYSDPCTNISHK